MATSQTSTRLSTANEIALAFGGSGAASASGWHDFRCPAHDDKTASCGVKDDRDGKIAVKCHAGCERGAILDAIEARGLIVRGRTNRRAEKKPPEGLFGEARVVEPSLSYFPARGLNPGAFPDLSRGSLRASLLACGVEGGNGRPDRGIDRRSRTGARHTAALSDRRLSGKSVQAHVAWEDLPARDQVWAADGHALRRRRTGRRHDGAAGVRGRILGLGGGGLK
jgi:hypothetical protein